MYNRILDVHSLSLKKSFFLFGPHSTGKTTLLRSLFSEDAIINLLVSSTYIPLAASPSRLADMIRKRSKKNQVIVIDAIQKLPALLDEIHNLIETTNIHFIPTGSSARKLKRSGVNLLAGRA